MDKSVDAAAALVSLPRLLLLQNSDPLESQLQLENLQLANPKRQAKSYQVDSSSVDVHVSKNGERRLCEHNNKLAAEFCGAMRRRRSEGLVARDSKRGAPSSHDQPHLESVWQPFTLSSPANSAFTVRPSSYCYSKLTVTASQSDVPKITRRIQLPPSQRSDSDSEIVFFQFRGLVAT
jgi:hypothetical protein